MRFLCTTIVLLACSWSAAGAKTVALTGQQASIDLPDAWMSQASAPDPDKTSLILTAESPEASSGLQILVAANPHDLLVAEPDLVARTKEQLTNQALAHGNQVEFTTETATTLHDVPAYLFQYSETSAASKKMLDRFYVLAANGKIYILSLRTLDPAGDAELEGIANSFRFDSPPVLPVAKAPEHHLRYYLMGAAAVVVLVGAGIGLYYYRQRQLYE